MALDLDWAANFNLSQRKNDFLVVDNDPDSDAPAVPRDILLRDPDSDGVSFRATLNNHMILVNGVSSVTINARGGTTKAEVLSISGGPSQFLISTVYNATLINPILDIDAAGDITILPVVDSVTALQVQQADTSLVFDVDTVNALVGIGIAAPSAKLHVFGTADEVQLAVQADAGQTANTLEIQDSAAAVLAVFTPTGALGIGTSTPGNLFEAINDGGNAVINVTAYAGNSRYHMRRANGSLATPTTILTGELIGSFRALAHDGSVFRRVAEMRFEAEGTITGSDIPGQLNISIHEEGAATATVTERLTILNDGKTGINIAAPTAMLHVDQSSTVAAIPPLLLDQADIDQEMMEFATTIGVGNAIEAVGAKALTVTHFIKCTLPGGLTRYWEVGTIA